MPRNHADWLKAYLDYTSDTEPPVSYRFWSGVSTIASALRRKVYIDQHRFKWTTNFYIILVSPPAVGCKSTTIAMGREFLNEIPGVHFGPSIMTWQALPKALRAAVETVQIGDDLLVTSPITFTVTELGTLIDPKDKQMIDLLVDNWDAKDTLEKMTKTSGDDLIFRPWINIIAGTTPSWLREHYPKHMIGGGFTSRCIFVFIDKKEKLVAYPGKYMDASRETQKETMIQDLLEINEMVGIITLTKEAERWGESWYERHHSKPPDSTLGSDLTLGLLGRKQAHIHKLAIILSAAKTNTLEIQEKELASAEMIITSLQPDLERVFTELHTTHGQAETVRLVSVVRQRKKILQSALYTLFHRSMNTRDFYAALESAELAGHIYRKDGIVYSVEEEKK